MRFRTLFAVAAILFALPALAREIPLPVPPPAPDARGSLCYEVRVLKVPAGFCEKTGLKLARDTTLTDAQLRTLLEAMQAQRDANVMQAPKMTALDGETATVKIGEERTFVTGIDATKVKGQTVHVPKNTAAHIGTAFSVQGRASADGKYVHVQASLTDTRLVGKVELTPVTTFITPVFEGGSVGQPVPFTQYLQVPDIRKEQAERAAVVPNGGTLVVGGWKETGEPQGKKPGAEFEVVVLATVRTVAHAAAQVGPPKPLPVAQVQKIVYKLRHVAAADAAHALDAYIQVKKLTATVIAEPVSNTVYVGADEALQKQLAAAMEALDREPAQVLAQAMVLQVPNGFLTRAGLGAGTIARNVRTLTAGELDAFTEALRKENAAGTLDVLSRPQFQMNDNQTGHVRVGQEYPVFNGCETVPACGGFVVMPKVTFVPLGVTMNLTPQVMPEGKTARLHTKVCITHLGGIVDRGGVAVPVFDSHELCHTVEVAFGGTVVLRGPVFGERSLTGSVRRLLGQQIETLVIVTPHRVRPAQDVRPAGWFTK